MDLHHRTFIRVIISHVRHSFIRRSIETFFIFFFLQDRETEGSSRDSNDVVIDGGNDELERLRA